MAVSMRTKLKLKGTEKELMAMIGVLKRYVTVQQQEYKLRHNCCYLSHLHVFKNGKETSITSASDDAIMKLLPGPGEYMEINCSGPFGTFDDLTEVTLFEDLAVAAPTAFFTADSEGSITPVDMDCHGLLTGGILHLSAFSQSEMQWQYGIKNDVLHAIFNPTTKEYIML